MEVLLVLALNKFSLATLGLVARIVFSPLGTLGKTALPLVVVVSKRVVVMSTCQLNFAPSWNALKLD
jgi:hypothetical protein